MLLQWNMSPRVWSLSVGFRNLRSFGIWKLCCNWGGDWTPPTPFLPSPLTWWLLLARFRVFMLFCFLFPMAFPHATLLQFHALHLPHGKFTHTRTHTHTIGKVKNNILVLFVTCYKLRVTPFQFPMACALGFNINKNRKVFGIIFH